MTSKPSFSIVIPTYQRRQTVCDAVRALSRVDYDGEAEIIVVVDGSADGTADALRQLNCPLPLTIVEQANKGSSKARNRGASEAKADVILFLDDDMMAQRDILQQHAQSYAEGADAVIGDFPVDPTSTPGFLTDSIAAAKRWARDSHEVHSPFDVFAGHISVRRSAFEAIGGFDEKFTENGTYGNEDIDFGKRLLKTFTVRRNPAAIARQRNRVPPADHMRRARQVAEADLHFARKHPELAAELFERRGKGTVSAKLRLLSRMPLIPQVMSGVVVAISEAALKSPFRSSRKLAHLFTATYLVRYWSAVRSLERKAGGAAGRAGSAR